MSDLASHDSRYERLQRVREAWCRRNTVCEDRAGVTIQIDGLGCVDIPAFYLALGQAINGEEGYYGADLDAFDDCLCGGFGLIPPFTLVIQNADILRANLGNSAIIKWREAVYSAPSLTEADIADLGLPAPPLPSNARNYFDLILEILSTHDVTVSFQQPLR